MPVVIDNTVLVNLALVGRPDLVERVWGAACWITTAVAAEHQAGAAQGLFPAGLWASLTTINPSPAEHTLGASLPGNLGPGERACIAVAAARGARFASDDRPARAVARGRGIDVTGTLGLLRDAVHLGELTLDEANALLNRMIARGYRSPYARIEDAPEPEERSVP